MAKDPRALSQRKHENGKIIPPRRKISTIDMIVGMGTAIIGFASLAEAGTYILEPEKLRPVCEYFQVCQRENTRPQAIHIAPAAPIYTTQVSSASRPYEPRRTA